MHPLELESDASQVSQESIWYSFETLEHSLSGKCPPFIIHEYSSMIIPETLQ